MTTFVRIEAQRLMQDSWDTYFVDRVDGGKEVRLHSTTDRTEARSFAREHADTNGLRVVDETYVPEVMAGFAARFEASDAIQRAMLPEADAARTQFQHFYEVTALRLTDSYVPGEQEARGALAFFQNSGMAQTTTQRQRAFKESMKAAGYVRLEAYVTKEQRDKFRRLGGDEWLRSKIDRAKEKE